MPAGASKKREREYEELKDQFLKEGRYKGRETEVAARIVNKQRRQFGETYQQKDKATRGKKEDKDAPLKDYQKLRVSDITKELDGMDKDKVRKIRDYEKKHKNRKTLLQALDRRLG